MLPTSSAVSLEENLPRCLQHTTRYMHPRESRAVDNTTRCLGHGTGFGHSEFLLRRGAGHNRAPQKADGDRTLCKRDSQRVADHHEPLEGRTELTIS